MKSSQITLFVDIDGVLLRRDNTLAKDAKEFLGWAIDHFDCYWLTTRDRSGLERIITAFKDQLPEDLIRKIKPTQWETLKTEAIDLNSDFYWIDDGLLATERDLVGGRWIMVNVNKNHDAIKEAWDTLMDKLDLTTINEKDPK